MNKAADPTGTGWSNVTLSELSSLGFDTHGWTDVGYSSKTIAINNAIRSTNDTGSGVCNWDLLIHLVFQHIHL